MYFTLLSRHSQTVDDQQPPLPIDQGHDAGDDMMLPLANDENIEEFRFDPRGQSDTPEIDVDHTNATSSIIKPDPADSTADRDTKRRRMSPSPMPSSTSTTTTTTANMPSSSVALPTSASSTPSSTVIKRQPVDPVSIPSGPAKILENLACYVLADGIGTRQLEILQSNILKRGGILLHEWPTHRYHVTTQSQSGSSPSGRNSRASAARSAKSVASSSSQSNKKLPILIFVSSSIRTRGALQGIVAAKLKHDELVAAAKQHRLGVPLHAVATVSPPQSPTHGTRAQSPSAMSAASSGGSTNAPTSPSASTVSVRLRSNWRIHHIDWLVESFKRNALLPPDQFILDDMPPASSSSATNRRLDYPTIDQPSNKTSDLADRTTHASASTPAPSNRADTTQFIPHEGDAADADDIDDDDDLKYSDDSDLTTAASISAWNSAIASQLRETSEKYSAQQGQHFRAIAFRRAAGIVASLPYALRDASSIRDVKGVGSSTIAEIDSILRTGHSKRLETLKADPILQVHQLLQTVHGIGPKTAEKLYNSGIRTLDDLRTKVKLTSQQETYLNYYDELRSPIPRGEVTAFESILTSVLHSIDPQLDLVICGSFRRGRSECGDIDCLISHREPTWDYRKATGASRPGVNSSMTHVGVFLEDFIQRLHTIGLLTHDLITPTHRSQSKNKNIYESNHPSEMYGGIGIIPYDSTHGWGGKHRRIDLKVYHVSEFPFAILYFTGSKDFNRAIRLFANQQHSLSLSDKALTPFHHGRGREKISAGVRIECSTEEDIFRAIGLKYFPPTERDTIPPELTQPKK